MMAEYIEREAVLAWKHGGVVDVADIKAIPAADVAPVVRCRDCWNATEMSGFMGSVLYCPIWERNTEEECFCSHGERKGDGNDGT